MEGVKQIVTFTIDDAILFTDENGMLEPTFILNLIRAPFSCFLRLPDMTSPPFCIALT